MIYISSDHAGFEIKKEVKKILTDLNVEFFDAGPNNFKKSDDYPIYAFVVGQTVATNNKNLGILICGTGFGMCIAANKVKGIRAAMPQDEEEARLSREHNFTNVLIISAKNFEPRKYKKIIQTWLETKYSVEDRHLRRINLIQTYEDANTHSPTSS